MQRQSFGSGGGTSVRALAFCLGSPSLNPGMDLCFFQIRMAVNLFSLGVGLFLIMRNLSSFLSSVTNVKFINRSLTMYQGKGKNKSKKRPGKAHI